ncbi:apolipoprotein N-acyltransferase [Fluviicola sp.]|jgi:apolipoprotein N-acyltransferase|uniref:apolipoprotein N-acyltransferase n=1 Tax=Fluviicola sp. TaxID=1917219 RepID=UPI002824FFDF|nr:apolipoprotein N-acyltransferase [Fluviicola sp.]MDR0801079.1 apolipoprotein N-acyltransferase [Fluviicola sp.]
MEKIIQKRLNRWLLSILSGVFLTISFPETGSLTPLAFIAWIPLLLVESYFHKQKKAFSLFSHAYLVFFIYNVGTTWWIYYASEGGAYMAFLANSLLMSIAFLIYHLLKRKLGTKWNGFILICVWLSFEFLHFHWELSWPWLTLGNVFATRTSWVQWYSITGVLGGSLWILVINLLIFKLVTQPKKLLKNTHSILAGILLFIPLCISWILYISKDTKGTPYNVAIIQPNLDPYDEKFVLGNEEQLKTLLDQADQAVSKETQLVIAPETSLYPTSPIYERGLRKELFFHIINEHRAKWANAGLLIGASTYQIFEHKNSPASRFYQPINAYVEDYNSSVLFDNTAEPKIIHKSKLVLGVEKIPFVGTFPFLEKLAIDMEGGSGSLGVENEPKIFEKNRVKFSPVVCYESIYGSFLAKQAKKGSQFIAIITNDGWWKDTPGYKQHFQFARLRAIENNKYVVRSANTGKSGIISNRGDVLKETGWWVKTQFNYTIQLNSGQTLYQILGDFTGYFAIVGLGIFLVLRTLRLFYRKSA